MWRERTRYLEAIVSLSVRIFFVLFFGIFFWGGGGGLFLWSKISISITSQVPQASTAELKCVNEVDLVVFILM